MRLGLQGPSVLHFTDNGAAPNRNLFARTADWNWFDALEIEDWVPASKRGAVAGVGLANMKSGYQYVVALKNAQAQYWTIATGAWNIGKVLPGVYTLTVYKGVSVSLAQDCLQIAIMLIGAGTRGTHIICHHHRRNHDDPEYHHSC
jgi:hypothetical protein